MNKAVVLVLIVAFAVLVVDLRSEHVNVVRDSWLAWIRIGYSGVMVVLGAAALAGWERGGRQTLLAAFLAAFVVGALGFWLHTHGEPVAALKTVPGPPECRPGRRWKLSPTLPRAVQWENSLTFWVRHKPLTRSAGWAPIVCSRRWARAAWESCSSRRTRYWSARSR